MDKFAKKYGLKEDSKIKKFDLSRRMFCINKDKLFIAKANLPYSHAVWFQKEGWISVGNDSLMNELTRGIIDAKGDVHFYVGYNFQINKEIEEIFFSHLKELIEKVNLKPEARIFGGFIKQESGKEWPPRKDYGCVGDYL